MLVTECLEAQRIKVLRNDAWVCGTEWRSHSGRGTDDVCIEKPSIVPALYGWYRSGAMRNEPMDVACRVILRFTLG